MGEPTRDEMLVMFEWLCLEAKWKSLSSHNQEKIQAIRTLIEHGPEVDEICDCDDYKWLKEKLGGMTVFAWVHGQEPKENKGPFRFCPYCGKRVTVKEG